MKFEIREKVFWVQQRLRLRQCVVLVLVSSCSASLLLLIPRVRALLIYFWPLLLSTALFVAALLTIDESKVEEKEEEEEGTWQQDLEHVVQAFPQLERERSIIECVAEQHEGGMLHFDTLFLQANGEEEDVKEQSLPEMREEKGDQSSVSTHKEA
ncbi:hypothetical protein SUGI_1044180 [Cryptomeria japonica]|uniref:uncharacterized protein LOC131034115 n=1 Tax=Cryptomeria japonica TaxID=3369 RepID=UPI0024148DC9|nr:uncharacterized protein LOC131034115 [Cryptomeria japonica]GLJ49365.1 hypothetical protein SUGI_1044180 [Cryptomeria japonica]